MEETWRKYGGNMEETWRKHDGNMETLRKNGDNWKKNEGKWNEGNNRRIKWRKMIEHVEGQELKDKAEGKSKENK